MKKTLIISLFICFIIIGIFIWNNYRVIYSNRFFFSIGSRGIKILSNGKVYDDLEVEEPNHKENYKLFKTLSKDELKEVKKKIKENKDKHSYEDFIKIMVYGDTDVNPYKDSFQF